MKQTTYTIGDTVVKFSAPSIQKDFWFAEDARTVEEWNEVQEHVASCENVDYFMRENLSNTNASHYLRAIKDSRFRLWKCVNRFGDTWISYGYFTDMTYDTQFVRELTDEEKQELHEACVAEQAKFEKRLRTYIKRYGLSKCHFSTYWSNR